MATLKVLSSGSHGNCYLLQCKDETLILELGIKWGDILKGLNYNLGCVCGCLCSHLHSDHSRSIQNALSFGLSVYSCVEVANTYLGVKTINLKEKTRIGKGFIVQPIKLFHNVECYGSLIQHKEFGKMVFATDTNSVPYKFKGVQHWLLEANYSQDILIDNACNDVYSRSASENHLEINDTIEVLKRNHSSELQNVVLIHLSNGNSNEKDFKERVQQELGFENVWVANSGLEIQLNESEF
jgi:phosphoribosyl 1,2-cyclic phosphodiesterase